MGSEKKVQEQANEAAICGSRNQAALFSNARPLELTKIESSEVRHQDICSPETAA